MAKPRRIAAVSFNHLLSKDADEHPLSFGKYKGETPLAVAQKDPSYIIWVAETFAPKDIPFTQDLYELCKLTTDEDPRDYEQDACSMEELDGHLNFHK